MDNGMKIRATLEGDVANVRSLMNHVMETGLRKDAKTGQLIPAHFINHVVATLNGKTVLDARWGAAISKNPFLGFKVKGAKAGDKIEIHAEDNKGEKLSGKAVIS